MGLMTKKYKWIITNLDAHTIDLDPFQYSGTDIMTFRILNRKHSVFSAQPTTDDFDQLDDEPNSKDYFYAKGCAVPTDQLVNLVPVYPDRFNGKYFVEFIQFPSIFSALFICIGKNSHLTPHSLSFQ